ncbi:MAG: chemotaxis protein CheW [Jatrophihabitans sp.]|uniref:chemotaxis protein CheW n=1 Tax=Jatrophihabitans sp. TaxID=1932789 RepID=UPI003F81C273
MTLTIHATTQYCTFWADGLYFGLAVYDVQEVLRYQEMTPVPRAPEAVTGLINLRGQIVTAIDLRHRLGLRERPADEVPMNVIVRSRNEAVSLLVDDIGDVIDIGDAPFEPVPATLPLTVREAVVGVISLPEAILLVLDADCAADVPAGQRTPGGTK